MNSKSKLRNSARSKNKCVSCQTTGGQARLAYGSLALAKIFPRLSSLLRPNHIIQFMSLVILLLAVSQVVLEKIKTTFFI